MTQLVRARRGALRATCPRARSPARRAGQFRRRRRAPAGRAPSRPISPSLIAGARRSTTRIIMPRGCSATSSAAAPRRACSRRCARIAAWLIRSGRALQPYRRYRRCSIVYAATARREARGRRRADRRGRSPRPPRTATPARAGAGPGAGQGRPADVAGNARWGQADYRRPPARRSCGRLVEPAEVRRRARGGDAGRRSARPARRCSPAPQRAARRSACRRCRAA